MNNSKNLALFMFALLLIIPIYQVSADAWWGKGYKKPSWVKAHGGTIIHVTITGKHKYDYKGILRQNGKYVEVEFDKNMLFDDAKNGLYAIAFYDCRKDCRYQKVHDKTHIRNRDKHTFTIPVMARGGEDIYITYDTNSDKAWLTSKAGSIHTPTPPPTFTQLTEITAKKQKGKFKTLRNKMIVTKNSTSLTILKSKLYN